VEAEALKYKTPSEWRAKSASSYNKAASEGFLSEITKKLEYKRKSYTLEEVKAVAATYQDYSKWRKDHMKHYYWCNDNNVLNIATAHMNKSYNRSILEEELLDHVKRNYPNTHKFKDKTFEIDIYIPELNLGIEYNGVYWHSLKHKNKHYHIEKTEHFKRLGISIIHIWDYEWRDRKKQVLNFLNPKLGLCKSIGARKCDFRPVGRSTAKQFCEDNHIQGAPAHSIYSLGIFYNNTLVGLATFSKHHRNSKDVVLSRLCFTDGIVVAGGLSKLSKIASQHFEQDIITWVHKTLSTGASYTKAGWEVVGELGPDYFYITQNGSKVIPKQSRTKKAAKTPENMTELQHAELDGLIRVYDCGKIRLVYRYS
jgi:hypothetical protein